MIVTLTLNPSLDLTYQLAEETLGSVDVHRTTASSVEASGKGVNVSRDLHAARVPTIAVLPTSGATGDHLTALLEAEGVDRVGISVDGETRINTSLLLPQGRTIKVNGPGTPLTNDDLEKVLAQLDSTLANLYDGEHWLVIAGSLPASTEANVIGDLVRLARGRGIRTAVDASGAALREALEAGADLLAPNEIELAELSPGHISTTNDVSTVGALARSLAQQHGIHLLVSMGSAGAIHTDGKSVLHGTGPALLPVNTAGAGDAFLAGWLSSAGTPAERMARALAWGRSACLCPTTVDPQPGSRGTEGITVTQLSVSPTPTEKSTP